MVRGPSRLTRVLAATVAAYLLGFAAMLRWHWSEGPPHTQATLGLLLAMGLCAAMVGLSSVSIALAALHWTRRASGLIVGVAVLGLFWTPHFDWNGFLIWQVLVMFGSQTIGLVVVLGAASSLGCGLSGVEGGEKTRSGKVLQLSISDFLILAAALAIFCASMRGSRAIDLGTTVYLLDAAGGGCAAVVALAVLWACLGNGPVLPRLGAAVLVAPTGGLVYVLLERYGPLLFNWKFYAGVTTAQVVFMAIPCLVLRSNGFRFARGA